MSRSVVVDYREINWPSQDLILIFHPVLVAVRNNHAPRLDTLENQGQGESQSPRGSIARLPIPLFSDYSTVHINTDTCHSNETLLYRSTYIVVLYINLKTFVPSHPFVVPFSFSSLLPMYHSFDGGLLFTHMCFDVHRNKCLDFEIASLFVISVEWRVVYYWWIINFIGELREWRFLNLRHKVCSLR